MKQHITIEQLNELTGKAKEKLDAWLVKNHYLEDDEIRLARRIGIDSGLVLLSIGEMIEFLEEKNPYWGIYPHWLQRGGRCKECNGWKIAKDEKPTYMVWFDWAEMKEPKEAKGSANNLCDALFSAVKEILEK